MTAKKKQLNEFIYVESLHFLDAAFRVAKRSARFIQIFVDQRLYFLMTGRFILQKGSIFRTG
ncbi:hypothetical protein [Duncaniella freteri]|uniref:hypothetical protein n=1 Tax=Duncaniella freteri TaxID=2530391 RepID=UPI003F6630FB